MPVHPRQGSYHLRVPNAVGSALDGISIAATSETHTASDLHGEPSTTSKPQSVGSSSPTYAPGQFPMTTAKCGLEPALYENHTDTGADFRSKFRSCAVPVDAAAPIAGRFERIFARENPSC